MNVLNVKEWLEKNKLEVKYASFVLLAFALGCTLVMVVYRENIECDSYKPIIDRYKTVCGSSGNPYIACQPYYNGSLPNFSFKKVV